MSCECPKCSEHCLDCVCKKHKFLCRAEEKKILIDSLDIQPLETFPIPININKNIDINIEEIDTHLKPNPPNKIDHPSYYQGKKYEAIDIIEDYNLDFHLGNSIKYILRAGKKDNKLQDLNKAMWYLKRACQNIQNESESNDTERRS